MPLDIILPEYTAQVMLLNCAVTPQSVQSEPPHCLFYLDARQPITARYPNEDAEVEAVETRFFGQSFSVYEYVCRREPILASVASRFLVATTHVPFLITESKG
jgi:hypothetical protein